MQKRPQHRYASTHQLVSELEDLAAMWADHRRTSGSRTVLYAGQRRGPRWWWQFHQLAVSAVYVLMLYPAWVVRLWLPAPWQMPFFLALLACTAAATSLRLHLWFMSRYVPGGLPDQVSRTLPRVRWCDAAVSLCQTGAAAVIAGAHPEFAVLLVAVATSTIVASLVIEPATTHAAFQSAASSPTRSA
jgi:hypothetical protein